jgi:putative hydrolase of the HAD superfamily
LESVPLSIPNRVVVFDYGEVISRSPTELDRMAILEAAHIQVSASSDDGAIDFWSSYWSHRDALDRGTLSVARYWHSVADDLGIRLRPSDAQSLWAADFRSWISVEPATVDLLAELNEGGTRLALLSNAGFDFGGPLRHFPIASYFEQVFVSAELDALKPEPAIYRRVAEALGITEAQMVFIDNKSVNTDAAAALGITVHHFTGTDGLAEFLRSLAA